MREGKYGSTLARHGLRGMALGYVGLLLLLPLSSLFVQVFRDGVGIFWAELTRPAALYALRLTFIVAGITTVVNSICGTLAGFILVRCAVPGKSFFNAVVDLPFAIPTVATGLMLVLTFGPMTIIGVLFRNMGIDIIFALPGIVLAMLFVTFPFTIRMVEPVLAELQPQSEEAAKTSGASGWQTFWWVIFPEIRRGILTGCTLTFARSLGEFGTIIMVAGNVPMRTQTAPLYVFSEFESYNYAGATAVSVVLALVSFTMLLVLEYYLKRRT
jgi:sulfate transport system permease protein